MKKSVLIIILTFVAVLVGMCLGGYFVYKNYFSTQENEELVDSEEDSEVGDIEPEEIENEDLGENLLIQEIPELSLTLSYDNTLCVWQTYGDSLASMDPLVVNDRVYEVTCTINNIDGTGKIMINRLLTGGGYGLFAIDMADGLYYEANNTNLDLDGYSTETSMELVDQDWTRKEFEYSGTIGYFNEVWYYPEDPSYSMMTGFDWNGFDVVMGYEIEVTTSISDSNISELKTALDQIFESLDE